MLGLLKKRLNEEQFSAIFLNVIFDATEKGFEVIADLFNTDPAFVICPSIQKEDCASFQLIILAANFTTIDTFFSAEEARNLKTAVLQKLAVIYNKSTSEIKDILSDYNSFISRVNHPSKNLNYGISKALFYKYNLSQYQDEFFKRMQSPNPRFLQRLNELTVNFLWDWEAFSKRFKL